MKIKANNERTNQKNKFAVCNTCTIKLIEICYDRVWWFRPIREPLRLGMVIMGKLYGIDPRNYHVQTEACFGCVRFTKTALKDKSYLFRLLSGIINPVFDRIMETIVSKEEIMEAKKYAKEATQIPLP